MQIENGDGSMLFPPGNGLLIHGPKASDGTIFTNVDYSEPSKRPFDKRISISMGDAIRFGIALRLIC